MSHTRKLWCPSGDVAKLVSAAASQLSMVHTIQGTTEAKSSKDIPEAQLISTMVYTRIFIVNCSGKSAPSKRLHAPGSQLTGYQARIFLVSDGARESGQNLSYGFLFYFIAQLSQSYMVSFPEIICKVRTSKAYEKRRDISLRDIEDNKRDHRLDSVLSSDKWLQSQLKIGYYANEMKSVRTRLGIVVQKKRTNKY